MVSWSLYSQGKSHWNLLGRGWLGCRAGLDAVERRNMSVPDRNQTPVL
jgi:hypothetical protein